MRDVFKKLEGFCVPPCVVCIALIVAASQIGVRASAGLFSPLAKANRHPATVDDLLRQEDWGQAVIDPMGRLLVFEQTPPYDHLPDYSIPWSARYPLPNFGRIMFINLTASGKPRLLFEPEMRTLY